MVRLELRDPFRSILVRAVEVVYAIEAPRGTLYHRYQIGADGFIATARIVPPTSQNQAAIEADLRDFVQARIDLDDAELTATASRRSATGTRASPAPPLPRSHRGKILIFPNGRWCPVPTPDSTPPSDGTAVVIAIGNEFRRDDGAAPAPSWGPRPAASSGHRGRVRGAGMVGARRARRRILHLEPLGARHLPVPSGGVGADRGAGLQTNGVLTGLGLVAMILGAIVLSRRDLQGE